MKLPISVLRSGSVPMRLKRTFEVCLWRVELAWRGISFVASCPTRLYELLPYISLQMRGKDDRGNVGPNNVEDMIVENADRIRANTSQEVNREIDRAADTSVHQYAQKNPVEITRRIEELDREWDMERLLETNASALAFTGLALGITHSKKWLIIPGIVLPFLLQHALQGWCPPVPVFRRLGVRTRKEIDREKYALKVLRGDFEQIGSVPSAERALKAVES